MKREMTEDTARALEILQPLLDELGVKAKATDSVLILDNVGIGIGCNSTWATIMEAIGFLFWKRYNISFRPVDIDFQEAKDTIMRYWISSATLKKLGFMPDKDETDPEQT